MDGRDALGVTMHTAICPQFVSLVGLPGSGKTTLCRSLSQALGWRAFVIGDALRARAESNAGLRALLARGELAPEPIAVELIREAATQAMGQGLVIDGFPRHSEQVELAMQLFAPWVVLYLDVPVSTAEKRLRDRLHCPKCNWGGSISSATHTKCPQCGFSGLSGRPEDQPPVLHHRLKEAMDRLAQLLTTLRTRVLTINAEPSADLVLKTALETLPRAN